MNRGSSPRLDTTFVEQAAALYDQTYDVALFSDEFRGPILDRGYMTLAELARVVEWKTQRMKTVVLRNHPSKVEAVTRQAFACAEPWLAVWILSYLSAVSTRVASAILTVYDPARYTVLDVRAWSALKRLDLMEPLGLSKYGGVAPVNLDSPETYAAYLDACRQLAEGAGVSLRTLDRCLWTLDKLGPAGLARQGIRLPTAADAVRGRPGLTESSC